MKYLSLFSGVEAATLAWAPLGWTPVAFAEVDAFPSAVLAHRFPGIPNLGDVTQIDGTKYYGTVDLIVGGSPCQGFSVAGKQLGLDDPRSALALAYVRLINEIRPRWFVWENVPGVLSTNGGSDFKAFTNALIECGYQIAWRILDAQYVRVDGYPGAIPQRRRRLYVVGHSAGWQNPAKVLFESESLQRDSATGSCAREETAGDLGASADRAGRDGGSVYDMTHANDVIRECGSIVPTLQARMGTGVNQVPIVLQENGTDRSVEVDATPPLRTTVVPALCIGRTSDRVRRLTPIECERLMGFPDNWTMVPYRGKPAEQCPDAPRYKACGNSMCVNVMRWIGQRIQMVEDGKL